MTPAQYKDCLSALGLNHQTVAEVLGVSWRQSYRWAKGECPIPRMVTLVLATCIHHNTFAEQMAADADRTLKAMGRAEEAA